MEVQKLSDEVIAVRQEIKKIKDNVKNDIANAGKEIVKSAKCDIEKMRNEIAQLKDIIKSLTETIARITEEPAKHNHIFPIATQEDLDNFENSINAENRKNIVTTVKYLIGSEGLEKNLAKILSTDIIIDYNYDGKHNKKRLADYKELLDILYLATYKTGRNHKLFTDDLRSALQREKRRHFKHISQLRRKRRMEMKPEYSSEEDSDNLAD